MQVELALLISKPRTAPRSRKRRLSKYWVAPVIAKEEGVFMAHFVYWIGGSSCSGKSTCARLISEKHHCALYNTDEYAFGKYMFGFDNIHQYPAIEKYKDMLCEGVIDFINRDTSISYQAYLDYCHEVFPLIRNDIIQLSRRNNVIVEGAHILPELQVELCNSDKSVYLISSEEQQRNIWLKEMNKEIVGGNEHEINDYRQIEDKESFVNSRIGLHQEIAGHIKREAIKNKLNYIIVNNDISIFELQKLIESLFDLE